MVATSNEHNTTLTPLQLLLATCTTGLVIFGVGLFVLLPAYCTKLGFSPQQIGLCDGAFWVTSIISTPFIAQQIALGQPKKWALLGIVILTLASLGYLSLAVHFWPILFLRSLQGFGFITYINASWAWMALVTPKEQRAKTFSIFSASMATGALAPAIGQWLRHHYDFTALFLTAALSLLCALLLCLLLKQAPISSLSDAKPISLKRLTSLTRIRPILVASFSFGLCLGPTFAFSSPYLDEFHITRIELLFLGIALGAAILRLVSGELLEQQGPDKIITASLIFLSSGLLAFGLAHYSKHYFMLLLLGGSSVGLGFALIYPALNTSITKKLPQPYHAQGLSLVNVSIDLGSAAGAILGGFIATTHGYNWAYLTSGIITIILGSMFYTRSVDL